MSTTTAPARPMAQQVSEPDLRMMADRVADRVRGTETKPSLKSTEFWVYIVAVAGVLIASQLVGINNDGVDPFRADQAWWFITLMTIAYLGSRGLAKAGSQWRQPGEQQQSQ